MLRIQVLNAQNLPIPTAKERKTRIYCYSFSSGHYLYDSFKNNENTRNPVWEESFDVELFRCSRLYFKLFSSRLLSEEIFLGDVNIDVLSFLNQKPGSEILKSPYGTIRCEFKLSNCQSSNSVLNLSFTYTPTPYNPIDIKDVSKSRIHLWTTYSPLPTNPSSVINIELLQATVYKNKDKSESGTFLHFSKSHSWEDVGYSSMDNQVLGPTGPTQIRTFYMKRISEKYNFFIINSIEYTGTVVLNFVCDRIGKVDLVDDGLYETPLTKNNQIGIIKSIKVDVRPNKKICVPIYMYFEKKLVNSVFEIKDFPLIACDNPSKSTDFCDVESADIPFEKQIIEKAKLSIQQLNKVNFERVMVIPLFEKVSLQKVFHDYGLPINSKLRIHINGSTHRTYGKTSHTDYWNPYFIVFNKKSRNRVPNLAKELGSKPNKNEKLLLAGDLSGEKWHTSVDLDLSKIGIDNVVIFNICCNSTLESANTPGLLSITAINGQKETLLFRNFIYADSRGTFFGSFFRFEFIEDSWNIIQMRHYFHEAKRMNFVMDSLFANSWVMPSILMNDYNVNTNQSDSDKGDLIEEIHNPFEYTG